MKWDEEYGIALSTLILRSGIAPDLAMPDWYIPHTQVCGNRGKSLPGTQSVSSGMLGVNLCC